MPASTLEVADINWGVELLKRRRDPLIKLAPVFWRPAADASSIHRQFIEFLLTDGGAHGFRTDEAVLIAAPRGDGWLVDDMYVPGSAWGSTDGGALWNALDSVAHGTPVQFVCPVYENDRADFAEAAGLTIAESWWLLELPNGPSGGEAGVRIDLAGTKALTVAAPPVYDPGGPVLYIPVLGDAPAGLPAALESARDLGCPAIVVNQVAGDASPAQALNEAGFQRHCDYYTGIISPL